MKLRRIGAQYPARGNFVDKEELSEQCSVATEEREAQVSVRDCKLFPTLKTP